jgi:hypothetical protein
VPRGPLPIKLIRIRTKFQQHRYYVRGFERVRRQKAAASSPSLELRTMTDQKDPQRYVDKRKKKKRHLTTIDCPYSRLKVLDGYQDGYSLRGPPIIVHHA